MDKKTRRRVKGIAIFIVFLALAATIVQYQNQGTKKPTFNFKPSANEYRDLRFINKAQVTFSAENISKAQQGINEIIDSKAKQRIRKQNEGSFGAYLFTVNQQELPDIIEKLKSFGYVGTQIEQIDTALVNLDYESESARLASYENELTDLDKVRYPSDQQNRRKEALHALIHQSRSNLDKLRENENVLLYLTLSPRQKSSNWMTTTKNLSLMYLFWLGIFAVGMVLVFFGTKLLMYFLSALGIRGLSAGGLGSSYNYGGYGSYSNYTRYSSRYGYGGGSSKRKVKRIYKDKNTPSSEEEEKKQ